MNNDVSPEKNTGVRLLDCLAKWKKFESRRDKMALRQCALSEYWSAYVFALPIKAFTLCRMCNRIRWKSAQDDLKFFWPHMPFETFSHERLTFSDYDLHHVFFPPVCFLTKLSELLNICSRVPGKDKLWETSLALSRFGSLRMGVKEIHTHSRKVTLNVMKRF